MPDEIVQSQAQDGGEGGGEPAADPRDLRIATLEQKLTQAEEKLSKLPDVEKKFEVVDRLIKAVAGESDPNAAQYRTIFEDIKRVSPPGVRKVLELLEQDPDAVEKLTGSVDSLHLARLYSLNSDAHTKVIALAKKALPIKGMTEAEVSEAVFPFERALTDVINSNKSLRARFVGGDLSVVDEVFERLTKPYMKARVSERQEAIKTPLTPKAPPRGGSGSGGGGEGKDKLNLQTPKGRAEFHKKAVAGFFAKAAAGADEL